jgi:hypothetical protein
MTLKQAIRDRCRDCQGAEVVRTCRFEDCELKGLHKAKGGANRIAAIRGYCRWCMNGNPVSLCSSPDCAIYRFRAQSRGALKTRFLPQKMHNR